MSSSIGIAALEAEIISRKRNTEHANSMAAPSMIPNKRAKLKIRKMSNDDDKNKPQSAGWQTLGEEDESNCDGSSSVAGKSNYSEIHDKLSLKSEIYNNIKANPSMKLDRRLAANMTLNTTKDTYTITDRQGNKTEVPVNELPPDFWKNIDSDDDENVDDENSEMGGGYGSQSHFSASERAFDGAGGSFMRTFDATGEVRHANTMTEDRRDYGALYYNLGVGQERQRKFELLKELREETIKNRVNNNADNEFGDPLDRFTPSYASAYLNRLATSKGKDLDQIKKRLYGHLM